MDCKSGRNNYCMDIGKGQFIGMSAQGAFAEYVLVGRVSTTCVWFINYVVDILTDYRSAVELPDSMSFAEAAPLFCAGATMFNAILTASQPKGATLGIVGLGALGHLGIQVCSQCFAQHHILTMLPCLVRQEHGLHGRRCRCTRRTNPTREGTQACPRLGP